MIWDLDVKCRLHWGSFTKGCGLHFCQTVHGFRDLRSLHRGLHWDCVARDRIVTQLCWLPCDRNQGCVVLRQTFNLCRKTMHLHAPHRRW
ncbi:hypothetical protein GDO81_030105 [Engystomops pustulosus]|uniref:Uncharacterized protein n=1 Tax=Engystomops pustulosus TaxID=76066 RepID=A0AAV6YI06_ENGPU|nr:hypothetical protein GDO81_030105 [Engystomops pustulosus]